LSFYEGVGVGVLKIEESESEVLKIEESRVGAFVYRPHSPVIGDEAHPLLYNLLRSHSGDSLDADSVCFNKRLSKARKTNEGVFVILYSKWRIFSQAIETTEKKTHNIVKAACVLHNVIIEKE
jgi:hypothetical protein